MKKLNIFLIALCCTCFFACEEEDKLMMSDTIISPVLEQLLPENLVITETTNLTNKVGKWQWKAADYGYAAAANYTIEADIHGGKFEKPVELASSKTTSAIITAAILNSAAANFTIDSKPLTIDIRLKTVVASDNGHAAIQTVYSNVESITFTPYIAEIPVKDALYIVGGALYSWDNSDTNFGKGLQVMNAANSLPSEKIYTYTGFFKSGSGGFKLIIKAGDWDHCYAYAGEGKIGANNAGTDFPAPATEGYYTLTVNLSTLTFSMVPYTGSTATTYSRIGIIGDATPTGWDSDTALEQILPHIWILQKIQLTAGKTIKFRANNAWDVAWGTGTPDTYFLPFGVASTAGGNIKIEKSGEYFVSFNDLTNHYVLVRLEKMP